jgi:hypothetical protein
MTTKTGSPRPAPELGGKPLIQHLRVIAGNQAEELLAEVPSALRRIKTLLLVLAVSIPVFLAGILAVLWRLVR